MFKPKKTLSADFILSRISPLDIYAKYLEQTIYLDINICNTLREEKNPSFRINKIGDTYLHKDYGNSFYQGNCFQLVQQKFNCSFDEALEIIAKDFSIYSIEQKYETPKKVVKKSCFKKKKIKFKYRKFNEKETLYWSNYGLSESFLKSKNVFAVSSYFINEAKYIVRDIAFAYYSPEIEKTKIYFPKTDKQDKYFISDIPFDFMFKDNVFNKEKIILAKSRKDELILASLGYSTASIQAENIFCLTQANIDYLKEFKEVYICFGSDEQGKRESKLITGNYRFKHLNTPDKYLPEVNDISEMRYRIGKLETVNFLKSKL